MDNEIPVHFQKFCLNQGVIWKIETLSPEFSILSAITYFSFELTGIERFRRVISFGTGSKPFRSFDSLQEITQLIYWLGPNG